MIRYDPTLVDLTSNFFVLCTNVNLKTAQSLKGVTFYPSKFALLMYKFMAEFVLGILHIVLSSNTNALQYSRMC